MSRHFLALLICLLCKNVYAVEFVKTNVGNGLVLDVPASSFASAKAAFDALHKNMPNCQALVVEYNDPIISRLNTIVINKSIGGLCQVSWFKDELWQYTCPIPFLSRQKWVSIFDYRVKNARYFGDFTDDEKDILFNSKKCSVKRQ
jgi:hypothetical protein